MQRPEFVLVHGLGGARVWMGALSASLRQAYPRTEMHVAELPGHGEESADAGEGVFRRAAMRLLGRLAGGPKIVVLHSIATGLLPAMLEQRDKDLLAVFLLEGNMRSADLVLSRKLALMDDTAVVRYVKSLAAYGRLMLEQSLVTPLPSDQIAAYAASYRVIDPPTVAALARDIVNLTEAGALHAALASLEARLHCIWGSNSTAPDLSGYSADLHVVPNAGHNVMLDDPEAVADIIATALRQASIVWE